MLIFYLRALRQLEKELEKFNKEELDYIIVESHHAGAKSYRNLLEYFDPKFF